MSSFWIADSHRSEHDARTPPRVRERLPRLEKPRSALPSHPIFTSITSPEEGHIFMRRLENNHAAPTDHQGGARQQTERSSMNPARQIATSPSTPTQPQFVIRNCGDSRENGVFTTQAFERSELIATLSGSLVSHRELHTLQISSDLHLHDPGFVGLFLHSCSPNVSVNMQQLEVHALRDISPGEALSMDYASTEEILYRQFPCLCDAPSCRKWITGSHEPINEEGIRYRADQSSSESRLGVDARNQRIGECI